MKKALILLTVLASLVAPAVIAAEVGVIDEVKILTEYSASKDAQDQIAQLRTKIQNLLSELSANLEKANNDKSLSDSQKAQKQKDAEKTLLDEKEKAEKIANDLREKVEAAVQEAIQEESKAQNLELVISKDATFYGGKDITDAVLKRLASSNPKPKKK